MKVYTMNNLCAFWLSANALGRTLLNTYPDLTSKISTHALNHVISHGEFEGQSAASWLLTTPEGQLLALQNKTLRDKISRRHFHREIIDVLKTSSNGQALLAKITAENAELRSPPLQTQMFISSLFSPTEETIANPDFSIEGKSTGSSVVGRLHRK